MDFGTDRKARIEWAGRRQVRPKTDSLNSALVKKCMYTLNSSLRFDQAREQQSQSVPSFPPLLSHTLILQPCSQTSSLRSSSRPLPSHPSRQVYTGPCLLPHLSPPALPPISLASLPSLRSSALAAFQSTQLTLFQRFPLSGRLPLKKIHKGDEQLTLQQVENHSAYLSHKYSGSQAPFVPVHADDQIRLAPANGRSGRKHKNDKGEPLFWTQKERDVTVRQAEGEFTTSGQHGVPLSSQSTPSSNPTIHPSIHKKLLTDSVRT